jgi:hypothetical protein
MFIASVMKDGFDEFNFKDYQKLQKLEREDRRKAIEGMIDEDLKKKKFRSRKSYQRRDPKISNWWLDYVLDERGTFGDPDHRDGFSPAATRGLMTLNFRILTKPGVALATALVDCIPLSQTFSADIGDPFFCSFNSSTVNSP